MSSGLVDYRKIKNDRADLDALMVDIKKVRLGALRGKKKKAFLINAYNILVIKNVVDHYPIESPLDVDNFFTSKTHELGGDMVSLDGLEKGILFKEFPDSRLHFVLVCAAVGCPPLWEKPFTSKDLDLQLSLATKKALNSTILVDTKSDPDVLLISELFSWYLADFGDSEKGLLHYIKTKGSLDLGNKSQISFQKYNWALNSK